MTTKTTKTNETTERKVDEKAALKALSNVSKAVANKRAAKREEEEKARQAKRQARKDGLLEILNTGKPTAKSDVWGIRYALAKAVTATKYGATAEDLRACKALQEVTAWGDLRDPVAEYCEAMAADTGLVLAGLNALSTPSEEQPAEPAPEEPDAGTVGAGMGPAKTDKPARQPRQRKPRASRKDSKAA